MGKFLSSRWAPIAFGLLTAMEIGWVWGSSNPLPLIADETAYLLQARIFASGRWTAPGRPLPEFFEQFQTLVTPVFAGKYPPGHSLLLVPGVWLGATALMPILLAGIAGSLVFLLARKFANPWVGLLTWLLWTTSSGNLRFLPAYFSQNTTVALWLAGWWALAKWREDGRAFWLVALGAGVAWQVLTRPFTAIPYMVPIVWVVGREVVRRRAWRDAGLTLAVALAILTVIPVWNVRTTGDLFTTPYSLYSRFYFPYQRPGFGVAAEQAIRVLPPDLAQYGEMFRGLHAAHVPAAIPGDLRARLDAVGRDTWGDLEALDTDSWGGSRVFFSVFAIIGAIALPAAGLFGLLTGALEVLFHVTFAHPASWSLYYLEFQPPLAFLTAVGVWVTLAFLLERPRPGREALLRTPSRRVAIGAAAACLLFLWPLTRNVAFGRLRKVVRSGSRTHFQAVIRSIPSRRSIVFVRYSPNHYPESSLISNEPDLETARVWLVYDRGSENAKLQALAPERDCYLYDEQQDLLIRLAPQL
jgi:hypothetical protein